VLSACGPPGDLESSAHLVLRQVQAGDVDALKRDATAAMAEAPAEAIAQMQALIPPGEPEQARLISYRWAKTVGDEASQHQLMYEYDWPDRVARVETVFWRSSDESAPTLHGVFANVATREELRVNDFTFAGKPLGHYFMLLAVIATPLLMIYGIVLSIRTPGVKRRWLWCLLSLLAVFNVAMNWTTGEWGVHFLAINLINVGITQAGAFSPWILATSFPIGAIIVIVRMHLKRRSARSAASG